MVRQKIIVVALARPWRTEANGNGRDGLDWRVWNHLPARADVDTRQHDR
jgi:hypothetical protein